MWIITYKDKPAQLKKLNSVQNAIFCSDRYIGTTEGEGCITAPSRKKAIEVFLYHFGYTWGEREKGIEVVKLNIQPSAKGGEDA